MVRHIQGKGGRRWAAVVKLQATAAISPPPIFFPLVSYGGAHHSAANAVSERNLQRKITKTHQQLQQKELAKLKFIISPFEAAKVKKIIFNVTKSAFFATNEV
jgi:hypothetical protein